MPNPVNLQDFLSPQATNVLSSNGQKEKPDVVGEIEKIPGIDIMPTGIDKYVLPYLFDFILGVDNIASGTLDFLAGTGETLIGTSREQQLKNKKSRDLRKPFAIQAIKNIDELISNKYIDETGRQLDVADLYREEEWGYMAELGFQSAMNSAPSTIISVINPLAGGAILGASTAGGKYYEDLKNRPDETVNSIIFNSILAGGSEWGTEYLGGKYLSGLGDIGGKTTTKAVKEYTQGFVKSFFTKVIGGALSEAATETLNAVVQESGNVLFYEDEISQKKYIDHVINAAIPALMLGGKGGAVASFNPKAKENLYKLVAPKKWKQEFFIVSKKIHDVNLDISKANPNEKKGLQEELDNLIKQRDKKISDLNTSFENLTNKEFIEYAENLDKINKNLDKIGNNKFSETTQERAEQENLKLLQENFDLIGKEYTAEDIETEKIIGETLKASEIIEQRLGKLKGVNRDDLDIVIVKNDKDLDKLSDKNKDGVKNSDGAFIGKNENGKATIYINQQVAALAGATNVVGHELLHYMISRKFKTDNKSMEPLIGELKDYLQKNHSEAYSKVQKRIDNFYTDKKTGKIKEGALEEYLNVFSDLIAKEKINISESGSKGFTKGLKDVIAGFGFGNIKLETAEDIISFLSTYEKNINRKGLLGKLMGTKILDIGLESSKLQKIDKTKKQDDTRKESRSKAVDAVNKMEKDAKTQDEFLAKEKVVGADGKTKVLPSPFDNVYNSIVKEGGAINNYIKSLPLSKEKRQETIDELGDRLINYNPSTKRKTDSGEPITVGEFLMSNIGFAKLEADKKLAIESKKEGKTKRIDAAKKTKEGETTFDIEDTDTSTQEALDEQDMSVEGIAKTKQDKAKAKEKQYSKFRKQLGIETDSDLYNKVIETAKKALLRAYEVGTSVRNIQRKLRDEASVYLFKDIKNFLGTKKYISNLKEYRTFIVDAIFTADLVQLEKMVSEDQKIFTVFDRELTSKADVEAAVEQNLLPKEALKVIDKGNAVRLYRKVMPTEKQFLTFFNQPAINPETGARSGLKGTRKDALAKAMAGSLSFDAIMEVAQDPEVAQLRQDIAEIKGESLAQDDIQQLASAIGRNPNVKFSMSNVEKNILDHVYELVQDVDSGKRKLSSVVGSEDGKDFLKIDIKRKKSYKAQNRNIAIKDKNFIAKTVKDIVNSNQYGKLKDAKLEKQYIEDIITARKKGKSLKMGDIHENTFRDQFVGLLKNINNKIQSVKAKGDVYFSSGITTLGIEIKLNLARGISQTINFVKGKAVFANKNETVSHRDESITYDDEIGALTEEQYGLIERLFIDNGLGKIADNQILTEEQAELLKGVKSLFTSRITMNNANHISWGYANGKYASAVQGMIEIGQSMFNLNNSEISNNVVNDYNAKNPNDQIKSLKLKDGKEITMISYVQISKNNKLTFRVAALLNDADFVSSSNVRTKGNSKILANSISDSLMKSSKSQAMSNIDNLTRFSRSVNNPTKGITILDFDDTLATSSSLIRFTRPDGTKGTLTPEQYASTYEDLLGLDYKFDFSEFNKVVDGKPAPLLNKAKKLAGKFGTDNMFILTARPQESAVAIQKFLKENGLNIPLKNITGLGNSTADAKALWVLNKANEGYNDFYFADDAIQNVKAVKNMLGQIDVKSKVQQARVKFSKSMNEDFNNILEDISGIESNKRFSEAKARRRGRSKGKFRYFIPPSHEDFVGLLYNFMGKGEKGNQHRNFFEQALVRPLNRAYRALNGAKQAIANDYRALIKGMPEVRKKLGKKILDGDYTHEDAIRVYLWDKAGFKIPGLSKTDQNKLSDFVKNDPALQSFADTLGTISKDKNGYVKPSDNWDTGGIKYDLIDATGRIGRAQFFQEFIENADIIFSEENLNKIEAIYGKDFREALKDMLYRVTNGTNRPTSKNKMVHAWIDWINGSVGATMFFNARSAILQQLSFVNFMNFGDNNIFKAAAKFANQKQFWSDFAMIFNSDYLKQRRTGAGFDVNASEIAREVSGSKQPVRAAIRYLLNLGFLPTQMGDSFAIAIGGSSFYRNRVETYIKQGLSKKEAEAKAFIDFQEIAEETQQSARPDMISQQQASVLGRFILAFQNVTSQYVRIIKKSGLDLKNRRISKGYTSQAQSDTANVSRIIYYGAVQSMIFYGLQTALFAMMFDDDEQDEEFFDKKRDRMINGTIDSILKGTGVYGAIVATVKNTVIKFVENSKSDSWFKTPAWIELLQISPPIGIKIRKISGAERTIDWNTDVIKEMETFDIDNPLWDAVTSAIEGVTNVPLNRLHRKIQNLRAASDSENAWWQRVAVALGWSKWDVGIEDKEVQEVKKKLKKDKSKKKKTNEEQVKEKENEKKQNKERKEGKETTCIAVTSKGSRCSNTPEGKGKYCTIHVKVEQSKSGEKKQCKKTKSDGKRCKMQTSSKSGYCYYHD